jgi:hypothetical protein
LIRCKPKGIRIREEFLRLKKWSAISRPTTYFTEYIRSAFCILESLCLPTEISDGGHEASDSKAQKKVAVGRTELGDAQLSIRRDPKNVARSTRE